MALMSKNMGQPSAIQQTTGVAPTPPGAVPQSAPANEPPQSSAMIGRQSKYNPFDAPIPGQSLTETPGNAKWEHPPQFADPGKAIEYVYDQLMRPAQIKQTIALIKKGVPLEGIARTILFTGFAGGKWTPDVAMIIAKPLIQTLVAIAKRAGVKNVKVMLEPDKANEPLQKAAAIDAMDATQKYMMPTFKTETKSGFLKR